MTRPITERDARAAREGWRSVLVLKPDESVFILEEDRLYTKDEFAARCEKVVAAAPADDEFLVRSAALQREAALREKNGKTVQ